MCRRAVSEAYVRFVVNAGRDVPSWRKVAPRVGLPPQHASGRRARALLLRSVRRPAPRRAAASAGWPSHAGPPTGSGRVSSGARAAGRQRPHGGSREDHLCWRSSIGQREFDELLAGQGGVCAVCGDPDPEHVDHDHRTGWVRGILCFNCNGGLGQFRDSPTRLARAITYLRGTTWQRALIHPGVYQMCSPTRGRPPSPRF
ncbi:endonuclease VII domain-containing protein [Micromonospora sp. NPDC093243]|uniref:endonuclease VII domain-containing protein n=1 Tax=Micromonospora sp. NPDC093243 TaxID=3364290 RepID=UPI003823D0DA